MQHFLLQWVIPSSETAFRLNYRPLFGRKYHSPHQPIRVLIPEKAGFHERNVFLVKYRFCGNHRLYYVIIIERFVMVFVFKTFGVCLITGTEI